MIRIFESALAIERLSKSELTKVFLYKGFTKVSTYDENTIRFIKREEKLDNKIVTISAEFDDLLKTYTLTLGTYANIDFAYISDEIRTKSDLESWFKFKYPFLIDEMANT